MIVPPGIITLLTDFGENDTYVAQMKGVILSIAPGCQIVDTLHHVPPQDVFAGAMALRDYARLFPKGSIHLAVVDPGVGTSRHIVAAEVGGQRFVLPDNGLLTLIEAEEQLDHCVSVQQARYWRSPLSRTFHGRDIMAPVAAHWARGVPLSEFGPPIQRLQKIKFPAAELAPYEARGRIVSIDHFGNLITNVPSNWLAENAARAIDVYVSGEGRRTAQCVATYGEAEAGALILLGGSGGWLEVAVAAGSAAERLNAARGAAIKLFHSAES